MCCCRYARVFVAVADGWLPDDPERVSAESVAANLDVIRGVERHSIPASLFDEVAAVLDRIPSWRLWELGSSTIL
ncbi:hypothetical protein GCM10009547_01520 [Sporichthya brevicatena]|uniref:Uncharacterized protein n=1 Tax=Sporichthya brevicatena TaxID=171442 RepID=A0ABN1G3Y0_9ACTN